MEEHNTQQQPTAQHEHAPQQPKDLLHGTTPGPWQWDDDTLYGHTGKVLEQFHEEDVHVLVVSAEDKALIEAAPTLAQQVIDLQNIIDRELRK